MAARAVTRRTVTTKAQDTATLRRLHSARSAANSRYATATYKGDAAGRRAALKEREGLDQDILLQELVIQGKTLDHQLRTLHALTEGTRSQRAAAQQYARYKALQQGQSGQTGPGSAHKRRPLMLTKGGIHNALVGLTATLADCGRVLDYIAAER